VAKNPFTPTFGVTPPVLVGRDEEIAAFRQALDEGPGSPARALLFTGARGTGKTVLLNAVEQAAAEAGWWVASATTRPGVAHELTVNVLPELLSEHDPDAVSNTVGGVTAGAAGFNVGVTRVREDKHPVTATFRSQLEALARLAADNGCGLLVSLDEVQRAAVDDLREITQAVQHSFRANLEVAFVAAGLPSSVDGMLNDAVMTFLRRAERFELGRVRDEDVVKAIREPIESAGRTITPDALRLAVSATQGYPFFVQVVGHQTWAARPEAAVIDETQAALGVEGALRRAGRLVHAPAIAETSHQDRAFLLAMTEDLGPSRLLDVATRMGVTTDYAAQYRHRLVAAELIEPAGHGLVAFAVPFLREYLVREGKSRIMALRSPRNGRG